MAATLKNIRSMVAARKTRQQANLGIHTLLGNFREVLKITK